MAPKLRVLAHNARLEKRMQNEISSSLASVLKTNPKIDAKDAMWTVTQELLSNNPFQPPKDGKCPINDLPDEILGYIFSVGVQEEIEDDSEDYDSEEDDAWDDMDEEDDDNGDGSDEDDEEMGSSSAPVANTGKAPFASDSDDSDSDAYDDDENHIPFQVLVSHVCRRWRAVALDSHIIWTTLNFERRPNLDKAKTYIARAQGLPLNISIDCTFPEYVREEDHPDHPDYTGKKFPKAHGGHTCNDPECDDNDDSMDAEDEEEEEIIFLSTQNLNSILDVLEPEVSHWGMFEFRASTYNYANLLLSRLAKLPSAPMLETFQVYHFEDCENYEFFSGGEKSWYLPFHGNAPLLKNVVFWGIHIDWDLAAESFLTGLHELELSFHAKDVRPSYDTFIKFITNSPDIHTLQLSLSGPVLSNEVEFDAEREEGGWGPIPVTIPSLRQFCLQFHEPKYASALVQHFDLPNVNGLLLNFDEEDYSSFVRTLLVPVQGRTESLLQHIENMKISGLPCDVSTAHAFLDQLSNLKSLNIKVGNAEEALIFEKLINPSAICARYDRDHGMENLPATLATTNASGASSAPLSSPTLFCPKLETLSTNCVDGYRVKEIVETRKKLGAPLKKIFMSLQDHVTQKEEKWLRANVEELEFFEPSDSEEEVDYDEDEDSDEEWETDPEAEDGDEPPLISPLARHLGSRRNRAMDLD